MNTATGRQARRVGRGRIQDRVEPEEVVTRERYVSARDEDSRRAVVAMITGSIAFIGIVVAYAILALPQIL